MNKKVLIYIVEDSVPSAMLYQSYLDTLGYKVRVFHTGMDALEGINDQIPDVLIQDVHLPDISGLDILREVTAAELPTKTIVITSETELDHAVSATHHGAFDFIEKPFSKDRLLVTVNNALRESELINTVKAYSDAVETEGFGDFIGASPAMKLVYQIINNVAPSNANVFITGESGTGKELCASAIHQVSKRAKGPFIPINCAAIPKDLFESEIFGHVKGAFSGAVKDRAGAAEQADGGTLFLDEMCEMDLNLQAKLLRLIQSGTFQKVGSEDQQQVDVRFVCATNRDPLEEVAEGRFREDLYYRLNVVPIDLPPLRERGQDVMTIAQILLDKFNEDLGKEFTGFSSEAREFMLDYSWPGNVRELQNVVENVVIMNSGTQILPDMLPDSIQSGVAAPAELTVDKKPAAITDQSSAEPDTQTLIEEPQQVAAVSDSADQIQPLWLSEKQAIEEAIRICRDNIPLAAAHLGVSPSTIYRKMKSWEKEES